MKRHPIDIAFDKLHSNEQRDNWHSHFSRERPSWYGKSLWDATEFEVREVFVYVEGVLGQSVLPDDATLELLLVFCQRGGDR